MRRFIAGFLALFLLLLFTSCAVSNEGQKPLSSASQPQATLTDSPNTTNSVPEPATQFPLYLPLPYSYVFGFEKGDIYGFLHDVAVNNYSTRVNPKEGDLLLPSLRLIATWDAEDEGTYYLCFMRKMDYYDLAKFVKSGTDYFDPFDDGSGVGLGEVVRFKIIKDNSNYYYDWACTELLENPPAGDGGYAIRRMCGDKKDLAEKIINSPKEVSYIKDILPSADNKTELLEIYLKYFQFK